MKRPGFPSQNPHYQMLADLPTSQNSDTEGLNIFHWSLSFGFWPKLSTVSFLWYSGLFNFFSEAAFFCCVIVCQTSVPISRTYAFLPLSHVIQIREIYNSPALGWPGLGLGCLLNSNKIGPKFPPKSHFLCYFGVFVCFN